MSLFLHFFIASIGEVKQIEDSLSLRYFYCFCWCFSFRCLVDSQWKMWNRMWNCIISLDCDIFEHFYMNASNKTGIRCFRNLKLLIFCWWFTCNCDIGDTQREQQQNAAKLEIHFGANWLKFHLIAIFIDDCVGCAKNVRNFWHEVIWKFFRCCYDLFTLCNDFAVFTVFRGNCDCLIFHAVTRLFLLPWIRLNSYWVRDICEIWEELYAMHFWLLHGISSFVFYYFIFILTDCINILRIVVCLFIALLFNLVIISRQISSSFSQFRWLKLFNELVINQISHHFFEFFYFFIFHK